MKNLLKNFMICLFFAGNALTVQAQCSDIIAKQVYTYETGTHVYVVMTVMTPSSVRSINVGDSTCKNTNQCTGQFSFRKRALEYNTFAKCYVREYSGVYCYDGCIVVVGPQ